MANVLETGGDMSSSTLPKRKWGDPIVFVLERELSEVHLLLDNLSADASRVATDNTGTGIALPPLLQEGNWVERVCEINWPPEADDQSPKDAALLIAAKDYLNRLTWPADGSTIAFTLLVTQADAAAPEEGSGPGTGNSPSRGSLARRAYPDLVASAAGFRRWMSWLNGFLLFWLVFTCLLSWNVAFGNAALREFTAADTAFSEARAVTGTAAKPPEAGGQGLATMATGTSSGAKDGAKIALSRANLCDTATDASRTAEQEPPYREQPSACWGVMRARHNVALAEARLREWLRPWGWLIHTSNVEGDASSAASRFVTIMATAVLPVLYGILGAGAAVVRNLSRKVRKSTLGPRDLALSLQQLALGAVVGACISLFIAAPGDKASLIGPVALSGSAISFIAGFGVEQVFEALQALISRVFNIAPAAPAPPSKGPHLPRA